MRYGNWVGYHPFYITDDPEGGYEFKTAQERKKVKVFAGKELAEKIFEFISARAYIMIGLKNPIFLSPSSRIIFFLSHDPPIFVLIARFLPLFSVAFACI
jgi:hypothetical protein